MPKYQESVCYFYDDVRGAGGRVHRAFKTKTKSTGAATLRKLAEWICWARPTSATRRYFKQVVSSDILRTYVTYRPLNSKELKELSQLVDDIKFEKLMRGAGVK